MRQETSYTTVLFYLWYILYAEQVGAIVGAMKGTVLLIVVTTKVGPLILKLHSLLSRQILVCICCEGEANMGRIC